MKLNDFYQLSPTNITTRNEELRIDRPVSNELLFLKMICSAYPDYSEAITFDTIEPENQDKVLALDGDAMIWVAHPIDGFGNEFNSQPVIINMSDFTLTLGSRIYIKYCWIKVLEEGSDDDPIIQNWKALVYPSTSSINYVANSVTSTNIFPLSFEVPTLADNQALHFALEIHDTIDYSGVALESYDTNLAQDNIVIFDGTVWVSFPDTGVGTPFYSNDLIVTPQITINNDELFYIRYKFYRKDSDPAAEPWKHTTYPAVNYK